jgi:hypothetical protein
MTDLRGLPVAARDGRVGWLNDLRFDIRYWSIRYLVVETGELGGREALISPASIVKKARDGQLISTYLRRALIEAAATLHEARSLMREPRFGSMLQVVGCRIEGPDGAIGVLEDLVVDDGAWVISDLLVNANEWLAAHILLPPRAVRNIDWANGMVRVPFTRAELEVLHRHYLRVQRRAREGTHVAIGN